MVDEVPGLAIKLLMLGVIGVLLATGVKNIRGPLEDINKIIIFEVGSGD